MLLDFDKLTEKYHMGNVSHVAHVGAHLGDEKKYYDKLGIPEENQYYFEPQPHLWPQLEKNLGDKVNLYKFALGNDNKEVEMFVEYSNTSQSSSINRPKKHLELYPHIAFPDKIKIELKRFDDIVKIESGRWLLNCDVQSFELEVLRGMENSLKWFDHIILEVNWAELYENCPHVTIIEEWLKPHGFVMKELCDTGMMWGDAYFGR